MFDLSEPWPDCDITGKTIEPFPPKITVESKIVYDDHSEGDIDFISEKEHRYITAVLLKALKRISMGEEPRTTDLGDVIERLSRQDMMAIAHEALEWERINHG